MKRSIEENSHKNLEHTNSEVNNIIEFFNLHKGNLDANELSFILNKVQQEIYVKFSLARNMVPSDVWIKIFQLISSSDGIDISFTASLRSVCKRWNNIFFDCQLCEAKLKYSSKSIDYLKSFPHLQTIFVENSFKFPAEYFEKYLTKVSTLKFREFPASMKIQCFLKIKKKPDIESLFKNLKNLKSLQHASASQLLVRVEPKPSGTLVHFPNLIFFQSFTETLQKLKLRVLEDQNVVQFFDILKSFKSLKKLDIECISEYSEHFIGDLSRNSIQTFFSNLGNFKSIKFPRIFSLSCDEVQKNNPNIKFLWYMNKSIYEYVEYRGEFNKDNKRHGIGTLKCRADRYVGEWKNDKRDGKGISIDRSGNKYDGEWNEDKKNGMGTLITKRDNSRYVGEFKNDKKDGSGILYHSDGTINIEGEWREDIPVG